MRETRSSLTTWRKMQVNRRYAHLTSLSRVSIFILIIYFYWNKHFTRSTKATNQTFAQLIIIEIKYENWVNRVHALDYVTEIRNSIWLKAKLAFNTITACVMDYSFLIRWADPYGGLQEGVTKICSLVWLLSGDWHSFCWQIIDSEFPSYSQVKWSLQEIDGRGANKKCN